MNPATLERFTRAVARRNDEELRRRTEYHAYLVSEKPWGEPECLEEFLRGYAALAGFGGPELETIIAAMQPAIPFPADLERFYRSQGSFHASTLTGLAAASGDNFCRLSIFSLQGLHARRDDPRPYARFHSMGLADSINGQWGNSRAELDPSSEDARYTGAQVDRLNRDYQVVASWSDASAGDEAHFYVYYDRSGRFGIVHLHQDDWESWPVIECPGQACADAGAPAQAAPARRRFCTGLAPLLEASGADRSWDEVVNDALDWIERTSTE